MFVRTIRLAMIGAAALAVAAPVAAQRYSQSYEFLEAVRKADGQKVTDMLKDPTMSIINTKSQDSGEGALHIVAKRSDATYLLFLLQNKADPNLQDREGNTPMLVATNLGFAEGVEALIRHGGNVNLANSRGETPLIRAVQLRNLELARTLLEAGADPDKTDIIAGMSARDYAERETRTPALTKLLTDAPKTKARAAAGPKL